MYATQSFTDRLAVSPAERIPGGLLLTVAFSLAGLVAFAFSAVYVPGFVEMLPTMFVG
jgi:hypothetical protein